MTLPSEGINPWRAAPIPGGTNAAKSNHSSENHSPAKLPDLDLNPAQSLDASEETADGKEFKPFGDDGLTFWDLIDVVNPLQHIPVVSTLYRDLTDDTLDPAPRVMGSTLFMGPIGLVSSVANVLVEHNTGQDVGSHVLAYFRDDSAPLSTTTAAAEPVAAGTDGTDPVTRWAAEQNAFYNKDNGGDDAVTRWAAEQHAFYQGEAGRTATQTAEAGSVTDWARQQHAYYRGEAPASAQATQVANAGNAEHYGTPAAAGTDGMDVGQWAADQHAYYQDKGAAADNVSRWAQSQHAYYRAGAESRQAQAAAPAAAGTDGIDVDNWAAEQLAFYQGGDAPASAADPVSAWAQRQTAFYRAGADAGPASVQTAKANGTDGGAGVSAWARDQLAWVMGDRAKELAALPSGNRATVQQDDTERRDRNKDQAASGAVAENGGWFSENMVRGWTRYQAAQQLADPSYRPELAVAAGTR